MLESEDFYASLSATAVALTIDQYETGRYGNGFSGAIQSGKEASFVFESPGADITLYVSGYDIDKSTEVDVLLNNISVGHLTRGTNNSWTDSSFTIASQSLHDGTNTLTFRQTPKPDARWGVTEILLLGPGPHLSVLDIDPEFSDDGYVAWQTADKFYLGRMDLDTGVFLGVLNQVDIVPRDLRVSRQGPELIRTAEDGMGAIGSSSGGLVYYNQNEEYLLAGTKGFRIGFLPKGETPGLRFTMFDNQYNPFLYDDGVITALDLDGGLPTSWLNEKEFVVTYYFTDQDLIGTYNLDTGQFTEITDQAYGKSEHQAAFTASDGAQFVALSGGNYHDIWRNIGNGWEFVRQISSPLAGGGYFYSPEFFEWQGHIFLVGVTGDDSFAFADPGAAALFDVNAGTWAQISPVGSYVDPEILVLKDNSVAYYHTDWPSQDVYFFTTTSAEVVSASVPDSNIAGSVASATGAEATAVTENGLPAMREMAQTNGIEEESAQTIPRIIADADWFDTFLFRRSAPSDDVLTMPAARYDLGTSFDKMFITTEAPFWNALMRSEGPLWQQKLEIPPLVVSTSRGSPTLLWNFWGANWGSLSLIDSARACRT